ncbi:MAG: CPBP family intramembrane metalloprotease [Thermoclostridium sp.]|nr:CPBP family intramembrane metalloprotease [Thermoclostridium sp.]
MGNKIKPIYLPKFWRSVLHLLLYFGIEFALIIPIVFFVGVISGISRMESANIEEIMSFFSNSLVNGILTIAISAVFLLILKSRYSFEAKTLFSRRYLSAGVILAAVITTVGAAILTSEADNFMSKLIPNWDLMGAGVSEMFNASPWWQNFLGAVIIAPLNEEFILRGLWLRGYTKHYKPWAGLVISSVIFGVMHMNLPQFVGATLSGLLLGWAYIKTKSIVLPIFIHAVHNSIALFGGVVSIPGFSVESTTGYQPLWFDALGLILVVVGIYLLNRLLNAEHNKIIHPRPSELAMETQE